MLTRLCRDVINRVEEVDVARKRRHSRCAKGRDAGDVDCWSDFIVNRRIETTVCVLEPRLVQRATAERRNVTDHCSLIRVT